MLMLGSLGDANWLGGRENRRENAMMVCHVCAMVAVLVVAFCTWDHSRGEDLNVLYLVFCVGRFVLGFAVGGMYPLGAALAAEADDQHPQQAQTREADHPTREAAGSAEADHPQQAVTREVEEDGILLSPDPSQQEEAHDALSKKISRVGWSFFWQIPGAASPFAVCLALSLVSDNTGLQFRTITAVGVLPCVLVVYLLFLLKRRKAAVAAEQRRKAVGAEQRWRSEQQSRGSEEDVCVEGRKRQSWRDQSEQLRTETTQDAKTLWRNLLGTGGVWLLFDVAFYGNQVYGPFILKQIVPQASKNFFGPVGGKGVRDITTPTGNYCTQQELAEQIEQYNNEQRNYFQIYLTACHGPRHCTQEVEVQER